MATSTLQNYLKVLDTVPYAVMVSDTDMSFKYVFWNKQCSLWTGISPMNVFNKNLIDIYGEETASKIISINKQVIETGQTHIAEERFRMPNGDLRYTSVEKSVINIDGHDYIVTSRRDKTEEHIAKQRANLILNNSAAGFVFLTPQYKVDWENVSSVFKDIPMSAIYKVGNLCYKDYFKRDSPCENCLMEKAIASQKPETAIFYYQDKATKILANPVFDSDKKLSGVVLRITDITDRQRQYEQLKVANAKIRKYSSLVDMAIHDSDVYTWAYDIEDDLFFDNHGLLVRYGLDPNAPVTAKEFIKRIHPDQKDEYIQKFTEVVQTGKKQTIDCQALIVTPNQESYEWFRYAAELIIDEREKKIILGTAQCIDNFVRERQLLSDLISTAENNSKNSFAFLANMSHEIRTPLNSIVGFSQLLEDTEDPDERLEYIDIIKTNTELLMNLINDILDMSKIEAGTMVNRPAPFDFAVYFDKIIDSLKHRLTNPDIKLVIENPYKSCIVELDQNRVAQVITNYVTNAFKYTEKGSVTIGYSCLGKGIRIYVTDTGIGIPKDKQDKVFGRFAKLDNHANGNGLGLSIVKALTESIGGKVGFESEEGVGSTFWAWKPTKCEIISK